MDDLFSELDATTGMDDLTRELVKAPMPWPGGKGRVVKTIIKHLPLGKIYVEPFGGSGAVLLARPKVKLEVYNDKYGGVVEFYRCLQDPDLFKQFAGKVDVTIDSREWWQQCKDTWADCRDPVERAFRWYYMVYYSFGGLARNWGRGTGVTGTLAGRIRNKVSGFSTLHERLRNVQIENLDWSHCFDDYDHPDAVFYCDPPYLETSAGVYKPGEMKVEDHQQLLYKIFDAEGFVALSSYQNDLYDSRNWDNVFSFDKFVSIQSINGKGNGKETLNETRGHAKEMLYIKEAK